MAAGPHAWLLHEALHIAAPRHLVAKECARHPPHVRKRRGTQRALRLAAVTAGLCAPADWGHAGMWRKLLVTGSPWLGPGCTAG